MCLTTPFIKQAGGQHPAGWMLTYTMFRQPSGAVRIDCIKDGYLALCVYNLTLEEANKVAENFLIHGGGFE